MTTRCRVADGGSYGGAFYVFGDRSLHSELELAVGAHWGCGGPNFSTNSGRRLWARSGREDHDRVAHRILRRVSRCPDRTIRTQLRRVRTSRCAQATGRFSLCRPPSDGKLCRDGDRPYCSRAGKHPVGSRRLEVTGRLVVSPQSERRGIPKTVGCGSTGACEQTAHLGRSQQQLQPFRGAIGNGGGLRTPNDFQFSYSFIPALRELNDRGSQAEASPASRAPMVNRTLTSSEKKPRS